MGEKRTSLADCSRKHRPRSEKLVEPWAWIWDGAAIPKDRQGLARARKGCLPDQQTPAAAPQTARLRSGESGDVLTYVPWKLVSMGRFTGTSVSSIEEGFTAAPEDIRFLLSRATRHSQHPIALADVVALRCAIGLYHQISG